jgi:DNA-binding MarR family transcriptional regulator
MKHVTPLPQGSKARSMATKKNKGASPSNTVQSGRHNVPAGVNREILLMAMLLTRLGRLNELFISSVNDKIFKSMKHGYGEPWVLVTLVLQGPPFRSSPTELSRRSLLTSGGMTKTLGRLEEAKLVTRSYDPGDRRALLVELTPKGQEWGRDLLRQVSADYADIFGAECKKNYPPLRSILSCLERLLGQTDTEPWL